MYFFCQLCNYPLLTERAEPWKLVADTRVTGSKDLVASSSASGGNTFLVQAPGVSTNHYICKSLLIFYYNFSAI